MRDDTSSIRPQYSFRPTDHGTLIWDVRRLVMLSRDLPRFELPLSQVAEIDETFWFAPDGPSPTCRRVAEHARLIADVDLRHPVILSQDGRMMDGMHRVCKALLDGRKTVTAVRFSQDPEPDYVDVRPEDLPYDAPFDPHPAD